MTNNSRQENLQRVPPEPENADNVESNIVPQQRASQPRRFIGDPERQPLLSPDDPGVSPLNVNNVRISKFILNVSSFLSIIWFILLLLSDFVSIPGLNNKGRSFLEINFILIGLFSTLTALLFFQVPSEFERKLGYVTSGILAFVLFLLLIFHRDSLGLIGTLSIVWALLVNSFTSLSEYLVEQGKIHEEIRLTGRVETRRSLLEWAVVAIRNTLRSILVIYVILIALNVLLYTFDTIRVKPQGELVSVEDDSLRIHITCYGEVRNITSQPIVLLESGHGSSEDFSEWVEELFHLGEVERYCIYDRPGYGFSDSSPSPISLSIVSDLLSEGLRKLKIQGPYALVGHDIGGLYTRVFASRHLDQVESILLVDAWHEDLLLKNPNTRAKKDEGNLPPHIDSMSSGSGFKLWLEGFFSPLGIPLQASWLIKHRGPKSRLFGKDMKYQGKYLRARLQEQISSSILSYNEATNSRAALVDIPISVVSSDYMIKSSLNWGNWQRQLTKLSTNTKEWKVVNGNHDIWNSPKGREQLQDVLVRLLTK